MKERIEAKINEVIDYILSKDVKDITYAEYRILDARYNFLKYEEENKKRSTELAEMTARIFSSNCSSQQLNLLPEPSDVK